MIKDIIFFEVKSRLKRLSSLIYFLIFFTASFFVILSAGGGIKGFAFSGMGIVDSVYLNSSFILHTFTVFFGGIFGIFIMAPIFGQAVYKDFHCRINPILFSCPMKKRDYLLGRWLGAVISCMVIFSSIALGLWLASLIPWVQEELFTENKLINYLFPYLIGVLPNILIFGSPLFCVFFVCRVKKMAPVYISGILLFVCSMIAELMMQGIDSKLLASLLDPFGIEAFSHLTEHWSVAEKNTNLVSLSHSYLYNRLLWLAIGIGPFIYTLFHFSYVGQIRRKSAKAGELQEQGKKLERRTLSPVSMDFSFFSQVKKLVYLSFFELRQAFKNVYFLVIYLAGVIFLFIAVTQASKADYGTSILPVTYVILDSAINSFGLFMLVLIIYYSGELIWRERDLKFHLISDALPYSNGISLLSKVFCLGLLQVVLLGTVMVCGVLIQSFKGYFYFELDVYLKYLFGFKLIAWFLFSLLVIFIHTVVNNKYLGHFVIILFYVGMIFLPSLGFEHRLYFYGILPEFKYSDMNGFGPFVKGYFWFALYWSLFASILTLLAYLFWLRGTHLTKKIRFLEFKRRFTRPVLVSLLFCSLATAFVGGFIYYNTNILNKYYTSKYKNQMKYMYETKYKKFDRLLQPAVKNVNLEVDIFPYKREMKAKGQFLFKNINADPIQTLFVHYPVRFVRDFSMKWNQPSLLEKNDDLMGISIYRLERPLDPGEELLLDFQVTVSYPGFTNTKTPTEIVSNGTFFSSGLFPSLGYAAGAELLGDKVRRKYGLQPKKNLFPKFDEKWARQFSMIGGASRVDFSAVVSTRKDQIAIVPGFLQKEWVKGERRYFHYKTDRPIWDFYSFTSGRYAVKRDRWKDVNIEIYHHPTHTHNLDRMLRAVKKGLEYYTREFSPYQHKQFRIIEFPRYEPMAISFPNTIPYSEAMGFISDVRDEKEKSIDTPFYVTAHELAHQWWGHQVAGAFMQGSSMLSESLSQYAALMVMEKEYGPHKMQRFLKYELNRYLMGRAMEKKSEKPLMLTENEQYIRYNKGSLVFYALKDYVGEGPLNAALREYIKKTAWQEAPYTTTEEFVEVLKENLSKDFHGLIDDLFKYITLYNNKAIKASTREKPNGKYTVTLLAYSKKVRADGLGKETEKPMTELVDIGVQNKNGDFIYLKKHPVNQEGRYEIEVESGKGKPYKAGIDPLNKLIDRVPKDNEVLVEFNGASVAKESVL